MSTTAGEREQERRRTAYEQRRAENAQWDADAHATEFLHDVSDAAPYMSMGLGISPGQAGRISLKAGKQHATIGAVHVALTEDGNLVVAIECGPDTELELRPTKRRSPWRFYDFWRHDKEKSDNVRRPREEWPTIQEYITIEHGGVQP